MMRAIAVKTTRTLNPNQACAFSDLRTSLCERNTKSFARGKSATKSLAIASSGRAAMGSSCRATVAYESVRTGTRQRPDPIPAGS